MTEPQPTTQASLGDCLTRLRALCEDLDQVRPEMFLTERSAPSAVRRELAHEAVANVDIVRQQMREAALRLEVAGSLHTSAVSAWIVDQAADETGGGGAVGPRTG